LRDFAFHRVILVAGVLFFSSLSTTTAQELPAPAKVTPPPDKPTNYYEPRQLRGWTLRIHKDLLEEKNQQLLAETLKELDNHLYRIERVVPDKAVGELKKVVLWLEHDNPKGRHAHYHPSVEWLKANGYNPDKAKGVEFGSARDLLDSVRHQPWMVLHELAHAYHDRVLGFDHPKVKEAYGAAKQSGKYEKVLIWNGHVGRHYAMTDHKEYFAESTEAFFGTNDIYPFVKAELKQHDPAMYVLLAELWGLKEGSGGSK